MLGIGLPLLIALAAAVKLVNYGRWAGRAGNRRGAFGLYAMAGLTVLLPAGVFVLNSLR